jgi:hypothetical protein
MGFEFVSGACPCADLFFCRPERGMGRRTCTGVSGEFARLPRRVPSLRGCERELVFEFVSGACADLELVEMPTRTKSFYRTWCE